MSKEKAFWQKKRDLILIASLFIIGIVAWFLGQNLNGNTRGYIIKSYVGDEYNVKEVALGFSGFVMLKGRLGDMQIEFDPEKGVKVASSTCRCQTCVNLGWSKSESVVCLPNATVIQPLLDGNKKYDAVTR